MCVYMLQRLTLWLDPIYKSVDGGATWSNFSAVKDMQNGWGMRFQPFLYTLPTDLKNWSDIVDDEAESNYDARPGMTTVAHIESTDKWIMTWERCGVDSCRIYYKISESPLTFGSIPGTRLQATDGNLFTSGPYVTWVRNPYTNDGSGIIIISTTSSENLLIQGDNPAEGKWKKVDINHWSAYSRSVREISIKGTKRLLLGNGGNFGDKKYNGIADAVVPIPKL